MSAYNLEKDLCRCCHAEGSFYNLAEPVYHLGKKVLYSEMLRNTLDIDILQTAEELNKKTYKICEKCVLRLRDASDFKLQVTLCEQRFKEMCHNYNLLAHTTIKVEIEQPPEISQQDSEPNLCPEVDLNIKVEPEDPKLDPEDYGMDSDDNGTPPSTELTLKKSTEDETEDITGDLDIASSSNNLVTNKNIKDSEPNLCPEVDLNIKVEPEEPKLDPEDYGMDSDDNGTPPSTELTLKKSTEDETEDITGDLDIASSSNNLVTNKNIKRNNNAKNGNTTVCSYTSVLKKSFNIGRFSISRHRHGNGTGTAQTVLSLAPVSGKASHTFLLPRLPGAVAVAVLAPVNGKPPNHLRRHTGEKPFTCDVCRRQFSSRSNLRRHVTCVHDKHIYRCDLCDKVFGHNSELNRHKNYHELFNYPK